MHADVLQIFGRLLETTELSVDDDFFEKGGDSLLATELLTELESLTGRSIPETLLFEASTVRMLADRLNQTSELQSKTLVKLGAEHESETPLLFFHGDWTAGGFYVKPLTRKLGPELPLIAVAPHGIRDAPIPKSIEAMALDRLPIITSAQSEGPYRLGGHCIGGMVAFEMARLLNAEGHRVELVVMVDPIWMVGGEALRICPEPTRKRWNVFKTKTDALETGAKGGLGSEAASNDDTPVMPNVTATPQSLQAYRDALARYSAAPLAVPLMIFTSEYDGRPWCSLSRDSELIEVAGGHFDWITTRIDAFAERVKSRLCVEAADRPELVAENTIRR
jgi:oxalate---CoA ligase